MHGGIKLKYLKEYGEMLNKLNSKISEDIKNKTDDELKEIELEAKSVNLRNSDFAEIKISRTVLEYVLYEKRGRQKVNI
jgi:hypothetical protein